MKIGKVEGYGIKVSGIEGSEKEIAYIFVAVLTAIWYLKD